ncbi:MAG TPA: DMT family transporter [Pyrinomonadaceae bacterium]|jgi:drug/metabolite transporter (DMT)-like permease|nr:DMT family transporter [Pyrinomonadaceae bacterium]
MDTDTTAPAQPTGLKPHAALVAVQLIFGTWPVVGKIALRALPATGLVTLRVVGAAIAFLLIRRATGGVRIERKSDYARLALYSLLGVVLNQFLFVKGLELSTVINSALLGTTIPVFTLLVSVVLGYESGSWRIVAGLLLAAGGVVYLIDPAGASFSRETNIGNLILLANSMAYGAYLAISQDMIKRYGALTVITWIFIFGSFVTLPIGGYHLSKISLGSVSPGVWFAMLYIIIVPTVAAYYLNAWALGRVAPSVVAIYIYLQPLIAFAVAPLILGESLNSRTWLAAALIFAGVATVTVRSRSRAIEEVSERPEALGR